jgi:Baseplate J-like protein
LKQNTGLFFRSKIENQKSKIRRPVMPLLIPNLDDRRYQELLDEALARVPVHNPEWTNFNKSDPGVTLIEIFAFLTESLLYRCNQIPERNRKKFLSLLGVPLEAASSARGLVQFTNDRGALDTFTLPAGREARAGQVPFYTELGLDVLPVESRAYFKRRVENNQALTEYYQLLYASYNDDSVDEARLELYETVPLDSNLPEGVDLGQDTIDGSLWIALLARRGDTNLDLVREKMAGRVVSLGLVPVLSENSRRLVPGGGDGEGVNAGQSLLRYELPNVEGGTELPDEGARVARYKSLVASSTSDVLTMPGVVQITLPSNKDELKLWTNLDPLEPGVGGFPPALEDTNLNDRLVTWLRVRPQEQAAARVRLLWAGINTTFVAQRARVSGEQLPDGTGAPDQIAFLSHTPVVEGSVTITVTPRGGTPSAADDFVWTEIDDLMSAGPEVPLIDPRQPPGTPPVVNPNVKVFTVNRESGEVRFGDGARGKRPPAGATVRASYDYGVGIAGNVGAGSINTSPTLPAGFKVTNPVRTWGGAEAETVTEGEKQIANFLQHRDRLVTAADFVSVTLRAPGVDVARVEVLPAYNPALGGSEPGDAAGSVTLMLIPRYDALNPDAPQPDRLFLDAVCRYLEPRRLVTTELFLRGPEYKSIWVSVGLQVLAGQSIAEVTEAVKQELKSFLSPLPPPGQSLLDVQTALLSTPQYASQQGGWPLSKPVTDRELLAVCSRVPGVQLVNNVLVAEGSERAAPQVVFAGLQLPRVAGISVVVGEPINIDDLRGSGAATAGGTGGAGGEGKLIVPVPVIPEEC